MLNVSVLMCLQLFVTNETFLQVLFGSIAQIVSMCEFPPFISNVIFKTCLSKRVAVALSFHQENMSVQYIPP